MTLKFNKKLSISPASGGSPTPPGPTPSDAPWNVTFFGTRSSWESTDTLNCLFIPNEDSSFKILKEYLVKVEGNTSTISDWKTSGVVFSYKRSNYSGAYGFDNPQCSYSYFIASFEDSTTSFFSTEYANKINFAVSQQGSGQGQQQQPGIYPSDSKMYIRLSNGFQFSINSFTGDYSHVAGTIAWTCDITWNTDGTFSLSNFNFYQD